MLKDIPLTMSDSTIVCNVSVYVPRPYLQPTFGGTVYDSLHSLLHPSIRSTQRLVTARFVCPSINSDVRNWASTCLQCERPKIQWHPVTPFSTVATPDAPFYHIHLDNVGPLPPCNGFTYFVHMCGPFRTLAGSNCDNRYHSWDICYLTGWVMWFGVPSVITTYQGGQFQSHWWQQLVWRHSSMLH